MVQAKNASDLIRGYQVPISDTKKFVGPEAGAYQQSPLATATGLLGVLGSAAAGTAGDRLSSLWEKVFAGTATPADTASLYTLYQVPTPADEDRGPGD
jgi:hypothetical protein